MIRPQELREGNILEEIFELLERHRLKLDLYFPLGNLYDVINTFDKEFQKFNSENIDENNIIVFNELLEKSIKKFLTIFRVEGFRDEPIFYAFKRFISFFSFVLKQCNNVKNDKHIRRIFSENFPSLFDNDEVDESIVYSSVGYEAIIGNYHKKNSKFENNFPKEIGVDRQLYYEEKRLKLYTNDFIYRVIIWRNDINSYEVIDQQYYMILDLIIRSKDESAEKLLKPLWLLCTAFENIKNVKVEIDSISKGSLKTSLKVFMKDLIAKEEIKALIETMKEIVVKASTLGKVSHSEIKKSIQETRKLELENEKLQMQLKYMPSNAQAQLENVVNLQRKVLENEKIELENTRLKLETITQLSELVAKGMMDVDFVKVSINDYLYLIKGENISKTNSKDISDII